MSRHGVIIKCGCYQGENHNSKGCFLKKMRIRPEDYVLNVPPVATRHLPADEVQLPEEISVNPTSQPTCFTQDSQQQSSQPSLLLSQMTSTMLMRMMEEVNYVNSAFCKLIHAPSITNIILLEGCTIWILLQSPCWASARLSLHQLKPTSATARSSYNCYQGSEGSCKKEEGSQSRQGCTI